MWNNEVIRHFVYFEQNRKYTKYHRNAQQTKKYKTQHANKQNKNKINKHPFE